MSAVTHKGMLTLWDTVTAQAERVYELAGEYGLAHHMLAPILTAALAAGHDAVACPDPMAPERLSHLIFPDLSLAKEAHDRLEKLYNPYVDFDGVARTADQVADEVLALRDE